MGNLDDKNLNFNSSLSPDEMKDLQRDIAKRAVFENQLSFSRVSNCNVVGVDQAFLDSKIISAVVVLKDGEIIERKHFVSDLEVPYIPGLLAFREGPCAFSALESLNSEPDIVFFDGNGRLHFRQAGIATHIGVIADVPSIGVAKNLLCGKPESSIERLSKGEKVRIKAGNKVEALPETVLGYAFQSKQYKNYRINPIYVSSGHRINNEKAVEFAENMCERYKLPEPIRLADKYADEIKNRLS